MALLDTGLDVYHSDIRAEHRRGRVKDIRSWVDSKRGEKSSEEGDEAGHGTFIASLILDLAPNVELYIARVAKNTHIQGANGDVERIASVSYSL